MKFKLVVIIVFLASMTNIQAQSFSNNIDSMSCHTAILKMFSAIDDLNTAKFKLVSIERVENEMLTSSAVGVIQYEPKKLFFRSFDEKNELLFEIMYIDGQNNNNALVSPNGFPFFNLNLNPLGSTIRNNRHLTILDAGGVYLVDMIRLGLVTYSKKGDINNRLQIAKISETETKLTISNSDYDFTTYTVKEAESMRDICYKLAVPEYKIIELNESVSNFDDLDAGQQIIVPTVYATKFEVIIRNDDFIPTKVKIYDEQGLFASYEYLFFETNPIINSQTFNKDNPAYTF
jgi:outer membrane lipoprotein-sorting protein